MGDTIAAIATPQGEGGIGIVRISGDDSLNIMKKILRPCPAEVKPRYAYYGNIVNPESENVIDEAICLYMKAPHSYTCEDVVEIQAHGGIVSIRLILRTVLDCGARMAEPGEFTKLAFLNGRMDLAQAEAVIDVIKAKSEMPLQIAERQLKGRLGTEISEIRESLRDVLAQMAVNIDFPDEDIEQVESQRFCEDLSKVKEKVQNLLDTCDNGRIAKEGIRVAIVGKPNVGKSSLMNALLGENRAIVTNIPGTTRDTIEESATIHGLPLVLTDTAGIRETDDVIEQMGIQKSHEEMEAADLVVLVLDGSRALSPEDVEILNQNKGQRVLVVLNKNDLGEAVSQDEVKDILPEAEIVQTSLLRLNGADAVTHRIQEMFLEGIQNMQERSIVTSERHRDALNRGMESIVDGMNLLEMGESIEICELQVHNAYEALGEIIGETAGDEILDTVFSKFCLGK